MLNPGQTLPIREGSDGVAYVTDLSMQKPRNADEVFAQLEFGNANRTQHPTDANAESSRSHALFQVYVRQKDKAGGTVVGCHVAKLSLIDLAGSERAIVTRNRGARFREGANINRSLLALGNCINALAEGKSKFVNYRDSKLTRLLKDSLGGNCYTVMIAAVSPSSMWYDDTHNTLQYANRAKNIKVDVTQNVVNVESRLGDYRRIIQEQREEIARLRDEAVKLRGGSVNLSKQGANEAAHALQNFEGVPDRCRVDTRRLTDKIFDLYNQLTKAQQERDRITALRMERMRLAQNLMMLSGSTIGDDNSVSGDLADERKHARESGSSSNKAAQALGNKLDPLNKKVEELGHQIEQALQSAVERTRLPETLLSSQQLVSPQLTACRNLARYVWEFSRENCQTKLHNSRLECELRCLKTEIGMLKKRQADSDAFIRYMLESVAKQRSVPLTHQARTVLMKPASFTAPMAEPLPMPRASNYWIPGDSESEESNLNKTITKSTSMSRSSSCTQLQGQTKSLRNQPGSAKKQVSSNRLVGKAVIDVNSSRKLGRSAASTSNLTGASPFKRPRPIGGLSRITEGASMKSMKRIKEGSPSVDWSEASENATRVRKTPNRYNSTSALSQNTFNRVTRTTPNDSPSKRAKVGYV